MIYCYTLDHIRSVHLTRNSSITQTFVAKYMPFGTVYGSGGTERFTYTGKQLDPSTGLYYYGYRYYDSQIGEFVSLDPQRPQLGRPQASNRYAYAGNNPMTHVDSDGRENKQTNPFTPRGPRTSQELFEIIDAANKAKAAAAITESQQTGQPIQMDIYSSGVAREINRQLAGASSAGTTDSTEKHQRQGRKLSMMGQPWETAEVSSVPEMKVIGGGEGAGGPGGSPGVQEKTYGLTVIAIAIVDIVIGFLLVLFDVGQSGFPSQRSETY